MFQFSCICGEPRTRVSWHWEGGKVGQCDGPQGGSAPIFRRTGLLYGFKCIYIKSLKVKQCKNTSIDIESGFASFFGGQKACIPKHANSMIL